MPVNMTGIDQAKQAELKQKLERALLKMPSDSADRIAKFLESEKIKGSRGTSMSCPIAKFLQKELADPSITIQVGATEVVTNSWRVKLPLPEAAKEFIREFDNWFKFKYPELLIPGLDSISTTGYSWNN